MTITSINYLAFCMTAVIIFLIFPKKFRWFSLLVISGIFYWISAKYMIFFMLFTSLTTWVGGLWLDNLRLKQEELLAKAGKDRALKKKLKKKSTAKRKRLLLFILLINMGILVVFKVFNHFSGAITALVRMVMGGGEPLDPITVIMPLGISYYTFSTIGYLLDIYWKRYTSEKNFARYLLFNCYFLRIIQGPISRYNRLGQELRKPELHFTWNNFVVGMESILLGCFKKLVIADRVSIFVSNTFHEGGLAGSIYLLAMIFDAIQIYADFSGYMDIVTGISRMFDIQLEQNFNHPFLSKSVPEFWRRWHMTLGGWFKDYIYYPISMSRIVKRMNKRTQTWTSSHAKTVVTIIIPVMMTWLLTGLWHGTGKGYVMWGIYYGLLILFSSTFGEDVQKLLKKCRINTECFSYRVFQTLKIFCIFMGGRFLAATMGLSHKFYIVKQILTNFVDFSIYDYGLSRFNFLIIIFGVLLLIAIAVIEEREGSIFEWFNRQNKLFCAVVLYVIIFSILLFGIFGPGLEASDFMYQQF